MGISERESRTVEVDDRGRITIPKELRERLGILPGDDLDVELADGELRLSPGHGGLLTAESGKSDWGSEAFPDSSAATFGGGARERTSDE